MLSPGELHADGYLNRRLFATLDESELELWNDG